MKVIETHIVPAISENIRLQEYAVSIFDYITTRSGIKKAIKRGLIFIDGVPAKTSDWIQEGQKIELRKKFSKLKVFELKVQVIYEDEDIAVINKPSGYPTSGNSFKTIQNCLPYNLNSSHSNDALTNPLPAHRLDNPTSGLLLCAKTRNALLKLQQDFAEKKIQKAYYALVHSEFPNAKIVETKINGKTAVTNFRTEEFLKIKNKIFSLVKAIPVTGRTHQIRIHLAGIQHHIVGDSLYGIEESPYFQHKKLYLFSGEITFQHPVDKKSLNFKLKLPKKFRELKNFHYIP